jgi:sec-independent protein translocase protein TatA
MHRKRRLERRNRRDASRGENMNIRGWEWLILLVIVLLLWGPAKLPDLARAVGKSVLEFRKGLKGVQDDLKEPVVNEPAKPEEPKKPDSV